MDFDISSQGVGGLARGVGNFSPLRGTLLVSSNRRLSDNLEIHFFDLFRYIFCKGTNKTTIFSGRGGGGGLDFFLGSWS